MKQTILLLSLLGLSTPLLASESAPAELGYQEEISLDSDNKLTITKDTEYTSTVAIPSGEKAGVNHSLSIFNASFLTNNVRKITIDKNSQSPAHLIELFDMSSTYGAVTGVIVYKDKKWEIAVIPDDKFELKDVDGDGVYEIIGKDNKIFQFEAGEFIKK